MTKTKSPQSTMAPETKKTPSDPTTAKTTKTGQLAGLLTRPGGATIAEMCELTGWQSHSVRGALAGALRRKGHAVTSDLIDGTRRYRIGAPA